MPFDPALPADATRGVAAEMRGQLLGLKELIDAVPAGPPAPPFAQAVVDAVSTGNPGESAQVSVSFDGTNVHFTFSIPRGSDGGTGANGNDGATGATGPQGPPFAQAVVDGVTTLNPGENATVSVFFDGSTVHFSFGIPRGQNGSDGATGQQEPAGEVSNAQLADALTNAVAGTARNPVSLGGFSGTVSDPPTQSEVQAVIAYMEALRQAVLR